MKKVLSFILVLTMLFSLSAVSSFASGEASGRELVIVEPGTAPAGTTLDEEITIDGAATAKWTTMGANSQLTIGLNSGDLNEYDTIHIELYSPKATDDYIGIHFSDGSNHVKGVLVDWEGWKTFDYKISSFSGINKSAVVSLQFWDYGWNYTYGDAVEGSDLNGSMNIGKIWCTDESRVDISTEAKELRIANAKSTKFTVSESYVYSELPGYLVIDASLKYNYPVIFHALTHVKDAETLTVRSHTYYIRTNNVLYGTDDGKIVIPTSLIGRIGTEYADTDLLNDVEFYFHGWGYENYDSADVITFNEVYFTDNPPVYSQDGVVAEGDTVISSSRCVVDTQNTLFGKPTNKWTFNGDNNFYLANTLGDLSQYNTLNIMLYSEKAVTDTIGIRIQDAAALHGGKDITVDWTGWKKVEIPLSNYSSLDKTGVTNLYFANSGWNYGWDAATGKVGNLDYMNIGKIWFSKNLPGFTTDGMYQEAEVSLSGTRTYDNKDLTNAVTLSFDIYNPTLAPEYYAAYILRDSAGYKQSGKVVLDFEGWKTVDITLNDAAKINPITIYISANWGLGGDLTPVPTTHGVTIKNVKVTYSTTDCGEAQADLVTESGLVSDNPFVFLNTGDIGEVKAVVTEKESGTVIEATPVICGNKVMINFEKEAGKTYNINLASIMIYNFEQYSYSFDYAVNANTDGFAVEAKDIVVSDANVKAYFDYSNLTGSAENATIVIAVYDALGKTLEATRIVNYDQLHTGRAGELYAELGGNYMTKTVKAFALDSFESLKPLCPAN